MQHNENMMSSLSRHFYAVSAPLWCKYLHTTQLGKDPTFSAPARGSTGLAGQGGCYTWFVAVEPSCLPLATEERHRDPSPRSHSIPEAAAERQRARRQPRAPTRSGSGLSHLCPLVHGITLARVAGHTIACRGEKSGVTSQSEQQGVNNPHPLLNVGSFEH